MRLISRNAALVVAAMALSFSACSSKSTNNDDDDDDDIPQNGSLVGTIDSSPYTATVTLGSKNGTSVYVTAHDASGKELTIGISGVTHPDGFSTGPGGAVAFTYNFNSQAWVGHLAGASGTVLITGFTATSVSGTYDVTLTAQVATGASGTKHLTGTFTAYFGQT